MSVVWWLVVCVVFVSCGWLWGGGGGGDVVVCVYIHTFIHMTPPPSLPAIHSCVCVCTV